MEISIKTINWAISQLHKTYQNFECDEPPIFLKNIARLLRDNNIAINGLLDPRIYFGKSIHKLSISEIEYNTLQLIKITALVLNELGTNPMDRVNLQELVEVATRRADISEKLKQRVVQYLPLLLTKRDIRLNDAKKFNDKILIFNKNTLDEISIKELPKYKSELSIESYDIFMELTDVTKILVRGNNNIFRPGNYHPFNILFLLIQRIGKEITYREIYTLAIKTHEKMRPRDHSKKVYDYLNFINNSIKKVKGTNPEIWFRKIPQKGTIQISKSFNACLITTPDKVLL